MAPGGSQRGYKERKDIRFGLNVQTQTSLCAIVLETAGLSSVSFDLVKELIYHVAEGPCQCTCSALQPTPLLEGTIHWNNIETQLFSCPEGPVWDWSY